MSESIRAYCIQWSVAFTTNCQLSGLSICPVQQCSPVPEPEPPYGSPYCCSALVIVHQLIPWGLLYTMYNACKKICERKDTRFRLRLCIRIRAGWKEAQQEECLENASGAGHCSSVLPLSAFGQDISHLILDDLVVSSVSQLTPRKSYSLAL